MEYKQAVKRRKIKLQQQTWEDLREASERKDMTAFWKVINDPCFQEENKPQIGTSILPEQWYKHFQGLYNNGDKEVQEGAGGGGAADELCEVYPRGGHSWDKGLNTQ